MSGAGNTDGGHGAGRYRLRLAAGADDVARAVALRGLCFRKGGQSDADAFDARCRHVLVEAAGDGRLVCCFRILDLPDGSGIGQSYAAARYGLERLAGFRGPMMEMGRFCIDPGYHDPDILRLAWAGLTRLVDAGGVTFLFGCSSFPGADPGRHAAALGLLGARYLGPGRWAPTRLAGESVGLAGFRADAGGGVAAAAAALPALLRSYLALGGWVSDHAVIDRDLDTLHVFTGLETASVPAGRAARLRRLAGAAVAAG